MKKIILMILFAAIAVSAQAREMTPGTVKLSGSTNISLFNSTIDNDGDKTEETDTLSLESDAVYFVTKNFGVGATLFYENSQTDFLDDFSFEETTTIIGPMVAIDVPLNETLNFIADLAVGYFQQTEEDSSIKYLDADGLAWGVSAGVAFFPVKKVSLDLTAKYQVLDGEESVDQVDYERTSMGVNVGVSVYLD